MTKRIDSLAWVMDEAQLTHSATDIAAFVVETPRSFNSCSLFTYIRKRPPVVKSVDEESFQAQGWQ